MLVDMLNDMWKMANSKASLLPLHVSDGLAVENQSDTTVKLTYTQLIL